MPLIPDACLEPEEPEMNGEDLLPDPRLTREKWVKIAGDQDLLFADGLDDAIIGVGHRCGQVAVVVYDVDLVYKAIQAQGLDYDDAVEWAEVNTFGGWGGDRTLMWVETSPGTNEYR